MTWKLGNVGGTVVSDTPYLDNRLPTADEIKYYGGCLVAESIPHADLARIIKAAPRLLQAAKAVEKGLITGRGSLPFMIGELRSAIAEAEGRDG